MDQCSGHDIPPAVRGDLTSQQGHDLTLGLKGPGARSAHLLVAQPTILTHKAGTRRSIPIRCEHGVTVCGCNLDKRGSRRDASWGRAARGRRVERIWHGGAGWQWGPRHSGSECLIMPDTRPGRPASPRCAWSRVSSPVPLQARSPWFEPKCAHHFFRISVQLSVAPHWFSGRVPPGSVKASDLTSACRSRSRKSRNLPWACGAGSVR